MADASPHRARSFFGKAEDWNSALRNHALAIGIDWVDPHQAFVAQPGRESSLEEVGLSLTQDKSKIFSSRIVTEK